MDQPPKRFQWRAFLIGLLVRLFGAALIVAGDHHSDLFHTSLVIVGVFLSITGITVLRYMLYASFKRASVARRLAKQSASTTPGV